MFHYFSFSNRNCNPYFSIVCELTEVTFNKMCVSMFHYFSFSNRNCNPYFSIVCELTEVTFNKINNLIILLVHQCVYRRLHYTQGSRIFHP